MRKFTVFFGQIFINIFVGNHDVVFEEFIGNQSLGDNEFEKVNREPNVII